MKLEQILTLAYSGLGLISGFISNYLKSITLGLGVPIAIYIISYIILMKLVSYKKKSWLTANSLITFILVWLVVWIFLFNTR